MPKSTQKAQSRGGATIAMNYWPEKLRPGVEPPISAEFEQALATILYVDIVRFTEKAARLGDRVGHR